MADELKPGIDRPIEQNDGSADALRQKLDTGMTVGQAMDEAMIWWESTGRKAMRQRVEDPNSPAFGAFARNPSNDKEGQNWLPSGIMMGKPWTDLTKDEKLRIVKNWHHQHVRVPNIDPELYLRMKARVGFCFYCDQPSCADEELERDGVKEKREMCWDHFCDRYPEAAEQVLAAQGQNDNGTMH